MQEMLRDAGSILGQEDPLEEGMATHSSILTWRIPWTEEPGGLQATGSQGHMGHRVIGSYRPQGHRVIWATGSQRVRHD